MDPNKFTATIAALVQEQVQAALRHLQQSPQLLPQQSPSILPPKVVPPPPPSAAAAAAAATCALKPTRRYIVWGASQATNHRPERPTYWPTVTRQLRAAERASPKLAIKSTTSY